MIRNTLFLVAMSIAACGMASASSIVVNVSGQFSPADTAGPLVAPGGTFNMSFDVPTNPAPLSGSVSSVGFDIPLDWFSYRLNGASVSASPSEITFNTLADGGLFDVTIGTGLTAEQFIFEGVQAFAGTTSLPVFSTGSFAVTDWTYSDPANFDVETAATVSIVPTPEPSTILLFSCGLALLCSRKFRTNN